MGKRRTFQIARILNLILKTWEAVAGFSALIQTRESPSGKEERAEPAGREAGACR